MIAARKPVTSVPDVWNIEAGICPQCCGAEMQSLPPKGSGPVLPAPCPHPFHRRTA